MNEQPNESWPKIPLEGGCTESEFREMLTKMDHEELMDKLADATERAGQLQAEIGNVRETDMTEKEAETLDTLYQDIKQLRAELSSRKLENDKE